MVGRVLEFFISVIEFFQMRWRHVLNRLSRIYLARRLASCGDGVYIRYPFHISGLERFEVGNNVHIQPGAFIRAEGGLVIRDNVHIARNVTIYTVNHDYKGNALPYDHTLIEKPVVIEENVWIGINVTIVPGATIGRGAIVGSGTVVAGEVPPLAIIGSQPFRILKYRDSEHYAELDKMQRYGGIGGQIYEPGIAGDRGKGD